GAPPCPRQPANSANIRQKAARHKTPPSARGCRNSRRERLGLGRGLRARSRVREGFSRSGPTLNPDLALSSLPNPNHHLTLSLGPPSNPRVALPIKSCRRALPGPGHAAAAERPAKSGTRRRTANPVIECTHVPLVRPNVRVSRGGASSASAVGGVRAGHATRSRNPRGTAAPHHPLPGSHRFRQAAPFP